MKIIYVKKIYILIVVVLVAFATFVTIVSSEEKTVAVSSTPVTNKRIIVDARSSAYLIKERHPQVELQSRR